MQPGELPALHMLCISDTAAACMPGWLAWLASRGAGRVGRRATHALCGHAQQAACGGIRGAWPPTPMGGCASWAGACVKPHSTRRLRSTCTPATSAASSPACACPLTAAGPRACLAGGGRQPRRASRRRRRGRPRHQRHASCTHLRAAADRHPAASQGAAGRRAGWAGSSPLHPPGRS